MSRHDEQPDVMAPPQYRYAPPPPDPVTDPATSRAHGIGGGALALVGVGAVLLAGRAVSLHAPACPLRAATGVPCPGCGMTRLADAVAHGRIGDAIGADVAGVVIIGTLAVLAVVHLVTVVVRKGEPPRWMRSPLLVVGLVSLVAIHWITTIITGGLPSS